MVSNIDKELRRRWWAIYWRTTSQKSYVEKKIENRFSSFDDFQNHAKSTGYELGYVSHRLDKEGHYDPENLVFVSKEQHKLLTREERRILAPDQVRQIRILSTQGESTRKIAAQFRCSQTLIWKILNEQIYTDIK